MNAFTRKTTATTYFSREHVSSRLAFGHGCLLGPDAALLYDLQSSSIDATLWFSKFGRAEVVSTAESTEKLGRFARVSRHGVLTEC